MPRFLLIAVAEIALRVRDRSALVVAFVAPVVLAVVTSLAFAGLQSGDLIRLLVVNEDRGGVGANVLAGLQESLPSHQFLLEEVGSQQEARRRLDEGDADVALVLPSTLSDATFEDAEATLQVTETSPGSPEGEVGRAVARATAGRLEGARLAMLAGSTLKGGPVDLERVVAAVGTDESSVQRLDLPDAPSLAAFFGPSMAIVFAMFAVGAVVHSAWSDLKAGTWARMVATTGSARAVGGGKVTAALAFGVASMSFVWLVTTIVFGVSWGPPPMVLGLILTTVAAAAAAATLAACFARNEEHLQGMLAAVAFGFALIGGNFLPPGQSPRWLEQLSLTVPNGWSLRAFQTLVQEGADPWTALSSIGVLLLFTVVALVVAVHRPFSRAA